MAEKQSQFHFTLYYILPTDNQNPEAYLDSLFEHGCVDCLVGTGEWGKIAIDFDRSAFNREQAINEAKNQVQLAIPQAILEREVFHEMSKLT